MDLLARASDIPRRGRLVPETKRRGALIETAQANPKVHPLMSQYPAPYQPPPGQYPIGYRMCRSLTIRAVRRVGGHLDDRVGLTRTGFRRMFGVMAWCCRGSLHNCRLSKPRCSGKLKSRRTSRQQFSF